MTLSKEARRREEARKKLRNARIAKGTVVALTLVVLPLLAYLSLQA